MFESFAYRGERSIRNENVFRQTSSKHQKSSIGNIQRYLKLRNVSSIVFSVNSSLLSDKVVAWTLEPIKLQCIVSSRSRSVNNKRPRVNNKHPRFNLRATKNNSRSNLGGTREILHVSTILVLPRTRSRTGAARETDRSEVVRKPSGSRHNIRSGHRETVNIVMHHSRLAAAFRGSIAPQNGLANLLTNYTHSLSLSLLLNFITPLRLSEDLFAKKWPRGGGGRGRDKTRRNYEEIAARPLAEGKASSRTA